MVSEGHGFESCSSLNFFRLLFQLLKLKAHSEDHNFTQSSLKSLFSNDVFLGVAVVIAMLRSLLDEE